MSGDIPVGSPPVPPGRHAAPGGWYPDPVDPARERYWDGWQWSRNTREAEQPPVPPASPGMAPTPLPPVPPGGPQPGQPYPGQQQYPGQPYQQPYPGQPYPGQPYPGQGGPVPAGVRPALLTADGVPVSGWWMRVLAAVLDFIFVTLVAGLISIPIYLRMVPAMTALFEESMRAAEEGRIMPMTDTTQLLSPDDQLQITLIALGIGLLYHGFFLRWRGATPGKLITGLRVVPVDQGRTVGSLPWRSVIIRALIWVLPGAIAVLLVFQLVDVLLPLGQPKRQAIHDLAAATQVIKKNP